MNRIRTDKSRARATGRRVVLGAAAALALLLTPVVAGAQDKQPPHTGPGVKRTTYDNWSLLCQGNNCAAATNAVRAVIVFGYNLTDGKLVMQIRVPKDAPDGRPLAIRLHTSGALLQLRVGGCNERYCTAAGAADKTEQVIQVMSKESSATVGYQLGQQMQIEVFSLKGFNKAIAELRKRAPKGK
jgi:invasion protein IalB